LGGGYGKERVSARLLRREAVERLERAEAGLHQLRPGVRLPRQLLGENQAGRKPQDLLPAPCAIAVNRLQKPWRVLVCLCETNWQRGAGYRARHPAEIGRSAKRPRSLSPPRISLICPWLKKVRYPVLVHRIPRGSTSSFRTQNVCNGRRGRCTWTVSPRPVPPHSRNHFSKASEAPVALIRTDDKLLRAFLRRSPCGGREAQDALFAGPVARL
jgi:hypothetical protein